ncbi:MAG: WXG100 family type VII secretion target [Pseudonocardia sp.]|nr:WXG100 family type VII secretion target [Pseudonocardia sp.]
MAAGFGTTTEEMEQAGRHVLSVNDGVQSELAALRAKLEPLRGTWTGMAAVEFAKLMARWDTDARALNQALGSIGESIQGSRMSYQQQEEQQVGSLSSITAALG